MKLKRNHYPTPICHIFDFLMEQQLPSFSILLTSMLFILIFFRLLYIKSKSNNPKSNLPPGPWKLPIIGNLHQLIVSLPHHRLADLAKKYGPIIHLQLGEFSTIVISSPETAKEVMKTQENNVDRYVVLAQSVIFYNRKSISTLPYGDYWKQLKKICLSELLGSKPVRSFRSIREEETTNFVSSFSSKAGMSVNLSEMLFSLLNGIMVRTTIGQNYHNQEDFMQIVHEWVKAAAGFNVEDLLPSMKLLCKVSGIRRKLEKLHRKADKMLEEIVSERRAIKRMKTSQSEVDSLADALFTLQDHGDLDFPLADDHIKAIIMEMFSSSGVILTVIEWAMSEMVKNQKVMQKAQEEVRLVFNEKGKVDETGIHELKFLKLVIKETLRLHPPVPLTTRIGIERFKINGYEIDIDTILMINLWAIGRDPNYWKEPNRFYPERFLDWSTGFTSPNFELLPFGAGRRMCPGMLFGIANVELSLAQLLYHFDWKLPNGVKPENLDMTEVFGAEVRRKHDLKLIPILYYP